MTSALLDVRFVRFVLNGVVSTAVHYAVLAGLIEIMKFSSAGLANGIAALFGISASYIGNKLFVFKSTAPHKKTLPAFLTVYSMVALLHAGVLLLWTDYAKLPYTFGFLIATGGSLLLTYLGNRGFVFNLPATEK